MISSIDSISTFIIHLLIFFPIFSFSFCYLHALCYIHVGCHLYIYIAHISASGEPALPSHVIKHVHRCGSFINASEAGYWLEAIKA